MPKKDYSTKKYPHPLKVKGKRKRLPRRLKKLLITLATVFLIGGTFYLFFLSHWVQIKKIELVNTDNAEITNTANLWLASKAGERIYRVIPKDNFFVVRTSQLAGNLELDKYLKSVDISKQFPNTLKIAVMNREVALEYTEDGRRYLFDNEGEYIEQVSNATERVLPKVLGTSTNSLIVDSKPTLSKGIVVFIDELIKEIPRYIEGVSLVSFELVPGTYEIKTTTSAGWSIFFDSNESLTVQLSNLTRALDEIIPESEKVNLEYIDVRILNYIYYK